MANVKEIFVFNGNGNLEVIGDIKELGFEGGEFEWDWGVEDLTNDFEEYFGEDSKIIQYLALDGVGKVRFESRFSEEEILKDLEEFNEVFFN